MAAAVEKAAAADARAMDAEARCKEAKVGLLSCLCDIGHVAIARRSQQRTANTAALLFQSKLLHSKRVYRPNNRPGHGLQPVSAQFLCTYP